MINFSVTVDGIETLQRGFNRLEKLDDWRSVWPNVIQEFHLIEAEQFDSEGAAGSGKWTPLKAVYAEFKEAHFPGKPILQATSDLRDSLVDSEAFGAITRISEQELVLGTSVPYAIFHQRGTRRGLPQRKVISLSEQQKRRIQKAVQAGLVRFVRDAGFGGAN